MKLNTIFSKLVPQGNKFYPILSAISDNLLVCADLFVELTKATDKEVRKNFYKQIKALETKGDSILGDLFDELNNTFITPFDREDINALGEKLDDVLDGMNSAAKRIVMYQPNHLPEQSTKLASLLQQGCELIRTAVSELDTMKKSPKSVKKICSQLHEVENEADDVYEHFILEIFAKEQNAIELIKLKEIMQEIERATDKADSVGKIIKTIVVKYA
jgi:predicted phosphate transport protein (TIGR00153 family)